MLWLRLWIKASCTPVIRSVYANVLCRQVLRWKLATLDDS